MISSSGFSLDSSRLWNRQLLQSYAAYPDGVWRRNANKRSAYDPENGDTGLEGQLKLAEQFY